MATIPILCQSGALIQLEVELAYNELPERAIYALPHVVDWLTDTLPTIEPFMDEGRQDPVEQLDFLLYEYVRGADIAHYKTAHIMEPHDPGIYELKTADIRMFGWFNAECSFIVGNVDTAQRCKTIGLYTGYRNNTVWRRDQLALDPPKFIVGAIEDVLCT